MALVLKIGSVICHSSAEESKSLALSLGNNKLRPRPTMWIVVPFNFIGIHLKTVEGILITVISILDKLSPPPSPAKSGNYCRNGYHSQVVKTALCMKTN